MAPQRKKLRSSRASKSYLLASTRPFEDLARPYKLHQTKTKLRSPRNLTPTLFVKVSFQSATLSSLQALACRQKLPGECSCDLSKNMGPDKDPKPLAEQRLKSTGPMRQP